MTDEPLPSPEAPPPPKKSWIHAIPHAWVRLTDGDTNCDGIPERLTPKTGCPKCRSAWMEVSQVAFANDCCRGEFLSGSWFVLQHGGVEPVMAIRLRCCDGHLVEYDGIDLTVIELPAWATNSALVIGAGMLLGAISFGYGPAWAAMKAP